MTSIDGYQMALQGRGGPALGIAAIGSFFAGTMGTLGLMLLAPPLAQAALAFGPPEYFALVVLGLTALAAVGSSVTKGLVTGIAGLLLGTIGIDPQTGIARFDFGQVWLLDGLEFIVLTVALFGVGEIVAGCVMGAVRPVAEVRNLMPTREDWRASRMPILRGSLIGFVIGVLPATGATIASFLAYIVEKKVAKDPSRFGKGAIEGVAGPEASNNAAAAGAMVPMLALGVPGSGTTAIILGALIMFGIRPGPEMFTKNADLVWAVIASMYIGNVLLLIMNLPLAGMFAQLLKVPYKWLYPPILALCLAGVFSQSNSLEDCWLLVAFGTLGWLMKRYDWPAAPMILGPGSRPAVRDLAAPVADDVARLWPDFRDPADLGGAARLRARRRAGAGRSRSRGSGGGRWPGRRDERRARDKSARRRRDLVLAWSRPLAARPSGAGITMTSCANARSQRRQLLLDLARARLLDGIERGRAPCAA